MRMIPQSFCYFVEDAKVHDGFQDAQVRTADTVLKTVQDTLTKSKFKRVLVTGIYIFNNLMNC